jgi:hypothetical protein
MVDPNGGRAHVSRSTWLQRSLEAGTTRASDVWDKVFSAIAHIEALPGFPSESSLRLTVLIFARWQMIEWRA